MSQPCEEINCSGHQAQTNEHNYGDDVCDWWLCEGTNPLEPSEPLHDWPAVVPKGSLCDECLYVLGHTDLELQMNKDLAISIEDLLAYAKVPSPRPPLSEWVVQYRIDKEINKQ